MPLSKAILEKPVKAPPIKGVAPGKSITASAFKGKWVVLYFYPKDMTSGCTKQAEAFEAARAKFTKAGAVIVGVSRDSLERHVTFAKKHGLGFDLISDEEAALCEAYGVWKEKSMYGRKFMGIERSTFLIDPGQRIVAEWRKVKVPGHVDEVLETLESLL